MKENLTTISAYQADNSYLKAKQEFETLRAEERENVLGLIAYFCKEFDITLSELNRAISTSSKAKKGQLYKNPETGQEWSGAGRKPQWLKEASDPSDYLVED